MKKVIRIVILIFILPIMGIVNADIDGEREALSRLLHEMHVLEPIIDEAQAQAVEGQRVRFQYAWLREDLERIKLGIQHHLNGSHNKPREIPPLRGDYRQ